MASDPDVVITRCDGDGDRDERARHARKRERKESDVACLIKSTRLSTEHDVRRARVRQYRHTWNDPLLDAPQDAQSRRALEGVAVPSFDREDGVQDVAYERSRMCKRLRSLLEQQGGGFRTLASGTFGTLGSVSGDWRGALARLRGMCTNWVPGEVPGAAAQVALKVELLTCSHDERSTVKENLVLRHLCEARSVVECGSGDRHSFVGRPVYPAFFGGGTLPESAETRGHRYRVSFMALLDQPVTMHAYLLMHYELTPYQYVLLERAVLTTWLAGVAHADLHFGNVLMVLERQDDGAWLHVPRLVDMGMAVRLAPEHVEQVRAGWARGWDSAEYLDVCPPDVRTYVLERLAAQQYSYFNWEGNLLAALRSMFGIRGEDIVSARQRLYATVVVA